LPGIILEKPRSLHLVCYVQKKRLEVEHFLWHSLAIVVGHHHGGMRMELHGHGVPGTIFIVVCLAAFVLLGIAILLRAWATAKTPEARSGILAGVGASFMTGVILAVLSLYLQQAFADLNENSTWRANVATSWNMAGLVARGHDLHQPTPLNFSGKELPDADFRQADAHGLHFRDAKMHGADFTGANMANTNLVGADLSESDLSGADLSGSNLQVARLAGAELSDIKTMKGAKVNANTCWPEGFLTSSYPVYRRLRAQLVPVRTTNQATNKKSLSLGYENKRRTPCRPLG
jgi:hypothetical protein